jgi:hypothetical protein
MFFFENRAVYEIIWKNTVERGRPQMTIRGVAEKQCDWQRCARTEKAAASPFTWQLG